MPGAGFERVQSRPCTVIWYHGAWMGHANQNISQTTFPYCSKKGCAEVDFEIATNAKNEHEYN